MRILPFIFLLSSLIGFSQSENTVIVDELTRSPIPYIVITTETDVLSANANGEITKELLKDIPFKVVSDSYETQIFAAGFSADTIFMEQEAQLLEETKIIENKNQGETYRLGYYNNRPGRMFNQFRLSMGMNSTVVIFVPYDSRKGIIEKLLIRMQKVDKDSMYTCLLYKVGENKKPGKEIFSYTISGKMLLKKESLDISNLDIEIPEEGIFVGVKGHELYINTTTETIDGYVTLFRSYYGDSKPKKYSEIWHTTEVVGEKKTENARFGLQMRLK